MIDPKFVVNLKGKDFPTWPGVLDAATKAGLRSLTTRIVQVPSPENGNLAVVLARAEFEDGRVFEDVGDCSPASTSPQLSAAALRLASTRAKGRVLRDGINVGQTMYEELPDEERFGGPEPETRAPAAPREPARVAGCERCGVVLTQAQAAVSQNRFGLPLCPEHQREARSAVAMEAGNKPGA